MNSSCIPILHQIPNFENSLCGIFHHNLVEYQHLKLSEFYCSHMSTKNRDLIHRELDGYLSNDYALVCSRYYINDISYMSYNITVNYIESLSGQ